MEALPVRREFRPFTLFHGAENGRAVGSPNMRGACLPAGVREFPFGCEFDEGKISGTLINSREEGFSFPCRQRLSASKPSLARGRE